MWVNGTIVIDVDGLEFRNSSDSVFQGMHFQTFFGGDSNNARMLLKIISKAVNFIGSTSDYATPKDQKAWFTDISGAILG